MRCHLCATDVEDSAHCFLIQIKRMGTSLDGNASTYLNVRARACPVCFRRVRKLRAVRLAFAVPALVGIFGALGIGVAVDSLAAPMVYVAGALALGFVVGTIIVAIMQRRLLDDLTKSELIDRICDELPDAGGLIGWNQVGLYAQLPRTQPVIDLDELAR